MFFKNLPKVTEIANKEVTFEYKFWVQSSPSTIILYSVIESNKYSSNVFGTEGIEYHVTRKIRVLLSRNS